MVHPAKAAVCDHKGEIFDTEFLAHIADEVGEVLLVLKRRRHSASIVPSLVPAKAHHLVSPSLQVGKVLSEVAKHLLRIPEHLRVIRTKLPARTRRTKIFLQALATPRSLDEENRFPDRVAHDMTEGIFGTDRAGSGSEARGKLSLAPKIPDQHIVAFDPLALLILEVLVLF